MSTTDSSGPHGEHSDEKPTIDQMEADLEAQRRELGETVDALTDKMDLKGRTKARASDSVARARQQALVARTRALDLATDDQGRPTAQAYSVAAGVAVVLGAVGVLWWRRRDG